MSDQKKYKVEDNASGSSTEEVNERGTWGGKAEFLLSCIGYAVGLGNVWRFPYLAYRNGGGAFLIPYAIMLLICGIPLFFMELAFGQFASLGPVSMWKVLPAFKGVGWGMVVVSFMVGIYYNMIIAWTLYYFFASMAAKVPWSDCNNYWNTKLCATIRGQTDGNTTALHAFNGITPGPYVQSGYNSSYLDADWLQNKTHSHLYNVSCEAYNVTKSVEGFNLITQHATCSFFNYGLGHLKEYGIKLISPAEEYWNKRVLRVSEGIEDTGMPLWDLTLCLLLAWIVIFFCLIKGVKSSGKVVYFTATFPYIILTILLIRGALLPGALEGIKFYITPQWHRLADSKVWKDAATQIFYSLGVGFGGLHVMASYNKFNNNCLLDAIMVSLINCCTSVYAGFAIFSMLGYMAAQTNVGVEEAATSGPGLAFIVYPEGLSTMPVAPLWSILFFFMLFTLGLDSQFAMLETVISGIVDEFPALQGKKRKMIFTGVACSVMFLLGLPMTCRGGIYWFQILDWYSASHCLLIIVFFEVIGIMYIYGYKNFLRDIEMMLGHKALGHWMYFIVCWLALSPIGIIFIIIFASVDYSPVTYSGVEYPGWGEAIGWLVAASSMIMIPLFMIHTCLEKCGYGYVWKACKSTFQPDETWGPALSSDRSNSQYAKDGSYNNAGYANSNTNL